MNKKREMIKNPFLKLALRDAHVHDAALYGTLAMQTNNLAGLADLDFFQCLHWFFLLIS